MSKRLAEFEAEQAGKVFGMDKKEWDKLVKEKAKKTVNSEQ